jgi:hypothetical protein
MSGTRENPETQNATVLSPTEARQALPGMGVRYVLVVSMLGAVAMLGLVYFVFFS